ncbi:MAG: PEGA domain-containing protein, partial [Meiothermus sp.]|nr:PEGA domain-containing protein [Meiothermus sp.]
MRTFLGLLLCLGFAAAQGLRPQGIIVNPLPPPDLQVRVWVDKDPSKTGNPVYQFGEPIRISVQVTQPAYVYLFSVRATGEIVGILPNAFEQQNFLQAGEVRTFPGAGARYTFTVEGPAGQDRVLAVASRRPLDVSEIIDIQTGRARIQGADNLARSLSIVVTPLPPSDWVTDEAYFIAGFLPPPPPTTGTLLLRSTPSGAEARINGRPVGSTPLTLELLPGSYELELRRSGYDPLRVSFTIRSGQTTQLELTLTASPPPTGTLAVESTPRGADVLVNGRFVGRTPLNLALSPGFYSVEVRRSGFSPFRTSVSIQPGRTTRLSVNLVATPPPPPP